MTSVQDLPRLVVTEPARLRGEVFLLTGRCQVLGRGCHADLRLNGPHIRHSHAVLRRAGNQTVVADLGSTTGTALNGVSVSGPRLLRHGDMLRFAGVHLRYEDGTAGAVADESLRERSAERRRACRRAVAASVLLVCGVVAGIWALLSAGIT
jgi:pSer/pThr/pTyr-binding forkhead associated (FHA) protein